MASAAASSSTLPSASSVPEWMSVSMANRTCPRGSIDALHMLAETALLDFTWIYRPSELNIPPPARPTTESSVLFSDLAAQPSPPPASSGPSSRSSSATPTPATTPTASPRLSSASTPCTTVVNTPSSGALVLPTKDLLAKATKRVAFAAQPQPARDAPQTRKSTRRAARTPAPAPPATPAVPAAPAAQAQPAKVGKAGKRKREEEEEAEVEEVLALPVRTRKAKKVVKEDVGDEEDVEMAECIRLYLDDDDKDPSTPCQRCGKTCSNKYEKTRHVLTHLPQEQKPYQCPHCDYGAVQKSNRTSHVSKKHGVADSGVAELADTASTSKSPSKSTLKAKAKKQTSVKASKRR